MAKKTSTQPALLMESLTPASPAGGPDFLGELNAAQREAVTHGTGPLLVVAGAGTGKTKVLTHRIAWLIQEGHAKPSEILALTFTDKAAGEMESRVDRLLPYGYTDTTIATFHAFGDQLLRDHALDLGLPPEFRVLGSDEQALFLADRFDEIEGLEELRPLGNPRKFVSAILKVISRAKDELVSPERYAETAEQLMAKASNEDEQREARRQQDIGRIYAAYETFKAERGVIDFGDQILKVAQFLDQEPRARQRLADQYKFILVDEFQDTNVAQYELMKRILGVDRNLTVVGDDDQCLPAGALVQTPADERPIEQMRVGDEVVTALGKGQLGVSRVSRVFKRKKQARLLTFTLASGRQLTVTDNHKLFCRLERGPSPEGHCYVYLMERRNLGWRIGVTSDLITRLALERSADRIVGIKACQSEAEARFFETLWSVTYGIPTVPFMQRSDMMLVGTYLERLFQKIDTKRNAERLAHDLGIDLTAHHDALDGVRRGGQSRTKIILTMCDRGYRSKGAATLRRAAGVRHAVSLETSDPNTLAALEQAGIPLTRAKRGWRIRRVNQSLQEIGAYAERLQAVTGAILEVKCPIGRVRTQHKSALVIPAANVLPDMYLPVVRGQEVHYERVVHVREERRSLTVYDLEIERSHNFVANGVVVHNSIYKFRGAAISNILQFKKDFSDAKTVVLTENYRSTQVILDAAYRLIKHNDPDRLETKLSIEKKLRGQTRGTKPVFHWYKHEADELDALAEAVRTTHKTTPLNEIAILVRSNSLVDAVTSTLATANIPSIASKDGGFLNRPEIRGLIAFLTTLVHPDDSLAHMKLAFSPYYQLEPEWVLAMNDAAKRARRSFHTVMNDEQSVAWQRLTANGQTALRIFRDDLARYRRMVGVKNAGEMLYQFLHDRGFLDRLKGERTAQPALMPELPEQERLEMVQNIAAVFDAIQRYIAAGKDSFSLTFVDVLPELMSSIVPPSVNLGPDSEAVQVLTVHAAKGLEFDTVFLPSLMADRFPGRRRRDPLELPDALIAESLPIGDEHLEEERRLAYVAMTRAKTRLILSGAERVGTGTRLKKLSPFVIEALGIAEPPPPIERLSSAERIHAFATPVPVAPTLALPVYDGLVFLSPAMIECYQRDPYDFYWKYVLKAPQPPSRHLVYGNAIHSAIEAYYRLRLEGKTPTLEQVLQRYAEAWMSEGFESQADENRQFEHGHETLRTFVQRMADESTPSAVEERFKLQLPGVVLNGRMDAVFAAQGEIRDFKTSRVETQKDADQKAAQNIPIRIYALAYQRKFGTLPKRVILDFVEAGLTAEIHPDQTMMDSTLQLIGQTVADIKAGKFEPNPSNPFKDYE